jgi:hypothetical protein
MSHDFTTAQIGTYGDPSVFYGVSTDRFFNEKRPENETVTEVPLTGATALTAGDVDRPQSAREILSQPAGLLLVLLPAAYIAFHLTFGVAA